MTTATTSLWAPLGQRTFRAIWIVAIVSNIGTWMHEVGAAWMMTTLTSDPMLITAIQLATSLPIFIFALPAGAMADIIDRRRYLLAVQAIMLVTASLLALCAWLDIISPLMLIAFTFALGCGAAFNAPAWQAITPELVPPALLSNAIALNSLGINISRAIGPALAGVLIAIYNPSLIFALNAVSFLGILFILYRWERASSIGSLPAERFFASMRIGIRYARENSEIKCVAVRAIAFFLFASAIWALLPLIAKTQLNQNAAGFGLLMAMIGMGAIVGAILLPHLNRRFSSNLLVTIATLVISACALGLAFTASQSVALTILFIVGIAWISTLSLLNVAIQKSTPNWVRARVLSIYLICFFGSMAMGSGIWGIIAKSFDIKTALLIAGIAQVIGIILTRNFRIATNDYPNLAPSSHWPAPIVEKEPEHNDGPVLITIEYAVAAENRDTFTGYINTLGQMRKRSGAFFWNVFHDAEDQTKIIEIFMVESWLEHLRQHQRSTQDERVLQQSIEAITINAKKKISHYLTLH